MARNKNGTFQKGQSGNPGGRPKAPVRFRELYDANECDDKIFLRLIQLMADEDGRVAIAAMDRLHDWRYGKTPVVDDNGDVVSDRVIEVVIPDFKEVSK